MDIVAHRVNTREALDKLPPYCGAEIDIRSAGRRLILSHDPYEEGEELDDWLKAFVETRPGRLLILNPKEEGLDAELFKRVAAAGVEHFFLLDLGMPSIIRLSVHGGEKRIALRVSEYEAASSAAKLRGKAEWAWLDCFSGNPPDSIELRALKRYFRVCLVSPELEGYAPERIEAFKGFATQVDAVCTKNPELWAG